VQSVVNLGCSSYPVSEEALRNPFEEWENINWWCGTKFIDSCPQLGGITELFRVRCIDRWGSNTVDLYIISIYLEIPRVSSTYAHDDTVTEPLEMICPIVCVNQHIMQ
jgi:hypothetical protein